MQNYGKKIAELRLAKNMTQAQLGKELNVTAQAVSKWEKGASEPDLNTIKSICEIFGITADEFFGGISHKQNAEETETAEDESAFTDAARLGENELCGEKTDGDDSGETDEQTKNLPVDKSEVKRVPIEICSRCGKNLYSNAEFEIREKYVDPHRLEFVNPREVVCSDCLAKEKIDNKKAELTKDKDNVWRGLVFGGFVGAVAAIIIAVVAANYFSTLELVLLAAAVGYGGFAFTAQCFYSDFLIDMLLFFCRSLKFPAIIFSFDLDGIAFLIGLKILFAIVGALFSITVFLFGLCLCLAVAAVTFPFSFGIHKRKLAEKNDEVERAERNLENKQ